jgi:hypothetical protein
MAYILEGATGRTVSFTSADGTFSWGCANCEFAVSAAGVGVAAFNGPVITFKLSPDGEQLQMTCRAAACDVVTAQTMEISDRVFRASGNLIQLQLHSNESIAFASTLRTIFTIHGK